MIHVIDNKQCCGCNACEQACPKHCIAFKIDAEGFHYPVVNEQNCIDCHLCEKVCPMLNKAKPVQPLSTEAIKFNDEKKRLESSSGGVFTAVAEMIIRKGGVVFGASFTPEWDVVHTYTESIEGLRAFRGSKYVHCNTNNSYSKVKQLLKEDRWVLFSGTPCQVRGLLLYLRRPYEKLLTADFICHGVPSPAVFKTYVNQEVERYNQKHSCDSSLVAVRFRDKVRGWKKFCFSITVEHDGKTVDWPIFDSAYMKGFGADLFLRPSCHQCPAKNFSSGADLTLADYWRIEAQHPEMDDDKGTSLVAVHTSKGLACLSELNSIERMNVDYAEAYQIQTALFHSMPMTPKRAEFWASDWMHDFIQVTNKIADRKTFKQHIILKSKALLRGLGVKKLFAQFSKRYR